MSTEDTTIVEGAADDTTVSEVATVQDVHSMDDAQLTEWMADPANHAIESSEDDQTADDSDDSTVGDEADDDLGGDEDLGTGDDDDGTGDDDYLDAPELKGLTPEVIEELVLLKDLDPKDVEALAALTDEEIDELEDMAADGSDDGDAVDYEAFYKDLFAPMKANGRDVTVSSLEEARTLMQQGLGYHKNMQEFKPYKKAMSLLKKRDALDPEKLDFLLDVSEGKVEALAKLFKDKNIDPMDVDPEAGDKYKSEYEDTEPLDALTEVLDSIPAGEVKSKTLNILSEKGWDQASKQRLYSKPSDIRVLHEHVENGTFDIVMAEVDKQKALGNYLEMSDLEAYDTVGNVLANKVSPGVSSSSNDSSSTKNSNASKKAEQRKKRQKAAGSTRKPASNAIATDVYNPATATDKEVEEYMAKYIEKQANK